MCFAEALQRRHKVSILVHVFWWMTWYKFQGQEAPVVVISMCSSAGDFGSRGLQFLLNKNRLNVAVSRAQSLTIIVGDSRISQTSATSVKDMQLINMFCRLGANLNG